MLIIIILTDLVIGAILAIFYGDKVKEWLYEEDDYKPDNDIPHKEPDIKYPVIEITGLTDHECKRHWIEGGDAYRDENGDLHRLPSRWKEKVILTEPLDLECGIYEVVVKQAIPEIRFIGWLCEDKKTIIEY